MRGSLPEEILSDATRTVPTIHVHINTFTSMKVLEAIEKALFTLRSIYGLVVDFELINESVFYGDRGIGGFDALIDVFGSYIAVTGEENAEFLADEIIESVLANLGRDPLTAYEEERTPSTLREPPSMIEAVVID